MKTIYSEKGRRLVIDVIFLTKFGNRKTTEMATWSNVYAKLCPGVVVVICNTLYCIRADCNTNNFSTAFDIYSATLCLMNN